MLQVQRTANVDGQVTVAVTGQIDMATAPQLSEELSSALDGKPVEIVVDLTDVDFMDSAGVRVLVEAARDAAQATAALSVRGAKGWVARVLEITGVDGYLGVTPGEPDSSQLQ